MDIKKEKIAEANNKLKTREELDKIFFKVDDALDLDLGSDRYSKVICVDTLEWTQPPKKAIEEIYRVLKPGGTAVIIHTDFDS